MITMKKTVRKYKLNKIASFTESEISFIDTSIKNTISYLGDDDDVIEWKEDLTNYLDEFDIFVNRSMNGFRIVDSNMIKKFFLLLFEVHEYFQSDNEDMVPDSDDVCSKHHRVVYIPDIDGDMVKAMILLARVIIVSEKSDEPAVLIEIETDEKKTEINDD